jgi:hypothetical protein
VGANAVAAATRALRAFIVSALATGRSVTLLPPGEDPPITGSGVNLYLYQVTESPFLKNTAFPGDRAGAEGRDLPVLSLDLSYLLTPFGPTPGADEETDEAHAALGEAMLALHDEPILNRVHRPGFDAETDLPPVLRDSFEDVRVRLHPLTVEDLSRIWSTIGKPYRLSVAYQVSLVQLRGADRAVLVPEVTRSALHVATVGVPRIDVLDPPGGPLATLAGGQVRPGTLTLRGTGLAGPGRTPVVTLAGTPATVTGAAADAVTVELPHTVLGGPQADVVLALGALSGAGPVFRVEPWATAVFPLRSSLDGPTTVVVTGSGMAAAVELVATDPGGSVPRWTASVDPARTDATAATCVLPAGATSNLAPAAATPNGRYELRARLASGALTGPRAFVVAPLVRPGGAPGGSGYDPGQRRLTVRGLRLDGHDVRLRLDGAEYLLGEHTDAQAVSRQFARPLPPGGHVVEVVIDGIRSDTVQVTV